MNVADMHCDTISELYKKRMGGEEDSLKKNSLHLDLERMKKGGYLLQNFALFVHLEKNKDPFAHCMELLDLFYTEVEKYPEEIGVVTGFQDIEDNRRAGRMSALLTIEEGAVCRGESAFLRNFYRLGVRMMTLTWNFPNELAWPNKIRIEGEEAFFEPDTGHGLTEKGFEFVEEMERLGMILDVSHLSDTGIWDVLRCAKKPFVASHSNARAVASNPRNLTDEMIRGISEKGGVAGLNYCAAFLRDWERESEAVSRISDIVAHMKHMKNVGGIQCIGLGSDYDGIAGTLELKSPGDMPMLEQAMRKAGFTSEETEAVFYKNVLRVYEEVLK